jgi:mRNA interferase MazF
LSRGDVHLVRFRRPDKERPVLLLTRDKAMAYLSRVTVAPITSTVRGVPSEVALDARDGMRQACAVNLHNLVTLEKTSLGRRVARLPRVRMRQVCAALAFALGCAASADGDSDGD